MSLFPQRRQRVLIPGPVLVGFNDLFDRSFGDPKSPRNSDGSYFKVTPSSVGGVLLPFACVHCSAVRSAVIDPKTRLGYHDKERDFSWCPACRGRYVIQPKGQPLTEELSVGATHAPALIERDGAVRLVGSNPEGVLAMLGAL